MGIDGFVAKEKPPSTPCKNEVKCVMDGPVCKLDLMSIKDGKTLVADDRSTATPSSPCLSDASPASTFREVPPWFRLPPGLELEVHNTFIHYKSTPSSQRAVQSMPHCMFQQHLLAEVLSDQSDKAKAAMSSGEDEISKDMFGADVVIEGLSKFPAFNGVCGRVQSFDEQSGRYTIMFPSLVCGHQFAKVKRDNFRMASSADSFDLRSDRTSTPQPISLTALV